MHPLAQFSDTLCLGVLQEVLDQLGVVSGLETRLNVYELGAMLGLPRWSVRKALLDEVGVGDGAQVEVMVDLFLQKTQDAPLLVSRVRQCNIQSRFPSLTSMEAFILVPFNEYI